MSTDDKIPPEIQALFDEARKGEMPAPASVKSRVWGNIEAQIAGGPAPTTPSSAVPASASAGRTAAVTGFAAGVLSGIAGTFFVVSTFVTAPETPVTPTPVEPVATSTPFDDGRAAGTVAMTTPAVPTQPRRTPISTPPITPASTPESEEGRTEIAWLDAARTALREGQFDEAMKNLEIARTRFPDGKHAEEREAIGVHVLISRGDLDAARMAVETFRKRHEGSSFLPAIEGALRDMEASR